MAKVILSSLLTDLSGKLAGSVFQNTVGGLQLRTKVSPRNGRTNRQQFTRSKWSFASLSWLILTPTQIASWNDNAPATTTGVSFFLSVNSMIALTGNPLLKLYSPATDVPILTPTFDNLSTSKIIIGPSTTAAVLPANTYLNVFITKPLSSGTTFISPSEYVYLLSLPPGTATDSPVDITAEYLAKYPDIQTGQVVGLGFYTVNASNGVNSGRLVSQSYVS
jgi:hypothetical protein